MAERRQDTAAPPKPGRDTGSLLMAAGTGLLLLGLAGLGVYFASAVNDGDAGTTGLGNEWRYDTPRREIPAELNRWKQLRVLPTGLDQPRGLAVDANGSVAVVGDRELRRFTPDGQPIHSPVSFGGEPQAVAWGADGTVYVALIDRLAVVPPEGEGPTVTWPQLGPRARLTSVAVTEYGIYVADAGNRAIYRYDRSGQRLGRLHPPRQAPDANTAPTTAEADANTSDGGFIVRSAHLDVAAAPDGLLRVAHCGRLLIEAYTPAGQREFAWGAAGADVAAFSGCCNPAHLAVLDDGRIVTSEKGVLWAVKVFAPDRPGQAHGALRAVITAAPPGNETDRVLDIAAAGERVYVLDPASRTVDLYQPRTTP